MILENEVIKEIGEVGLKEIEELVETLKREFSDHWVKRTLKVMESSYVLKAKSPTQHDKTANADRLMDLCFPFIKPFMSSNEQVVYLDVSCLPAGTKSMVHTDYAWIHVLSRRIHIPLQTHPKALFAALTEDNKIQASHLKVGMAYELNNQTLHAVANYSQSDRWHLLADVMDNTAYEYLARTGKLDKAFCNKWCNFYLNEKIKRRIEAALENPDKKED